MFKIKGDISFEQREKTARELLSIFLPLESLPSVIEYRTGININRGDAAWDFVINSLFESQDKLQEYQESTEHTNAVREASHISKDKAVIDYFVKKE